MQVPRLVIAGTASGVGKTTVAVGLVSALTKREFRVQPFKCGPDYIDPSYLTAAARLPARNLDSWMLSEEALREVFLRAAAGADVSLIEGVMGLYDGRDGLSGEGSSAHVAKKLHSPVVLVIDVSSLSGSAGAIALGYKQYDPEVDLAGVILNRVGSPSHLRWAREAIENKTGIPVLGHLPRNAEVELPERHLGLVPAGERAQVREQVAKLGDAIEHSVDISRLVAVAGAAPRMGKPPEFKLFPDVGVKRAKIAVAMDEAFSFYYQDNLDLLTSWGAELAFVSPLRDADLPRDAAGLYLGGGFPEVFGCDLERNERFRQEVRDAAEAGMPVYAECGGLMYLTEGIVDFEGNRHAMVGLVPGVAEMGQGLRRMGYASAEALRENLLSESGARLRGHVFHWSNLRPPQPAEAAYTLLDSRFGQLEGFVLGPRSNVLASYLHLHFASEPHLAAQFVQRSAEWARGHSKLMGPGRSTIG